ncbi:MAG TPA: hypothetical protein VHG08_14330 [Longimicrobium sp.]|nr:hypothetical protein [Longimicrobium sp.]
MRERVTAGLRPLLSRALIDIMEGRPPGPLEVPPFAGLDADALAAISGTFRVDGVGVVTLAARERRAYLRIGDGIEYPAFLPGDGQLYVPGLDVWLGFPAAPPAPFQRLTWLSIFHVAQGERAR